MKFLKMSAEMLGNTAKALNDALAAVLPDLLAAAWDEGYAQAVADHLLMYDGSDDTPNPYRCGTEVYVKKEES